MNRLAPSALALVVALAACNEAGPTAPVPDETLAPVLQADGIAYAGFPIPAPALSTTNTFPGGGAGTPIIDESETIVTLDVLESAIILDVNVALTLDHTFDADLVVRLASPLGTVVVLTANNGGDGDGYSGTVFDDEAANPVVGAVAPFSGSFQPQEALAAFDGEDQQGTWTLTISDGAAGDVGQLGSWALDIEIDGPPDDEPGPTTTLVIGGIDTGVANLDIGDGMTFDDAVTGCAAGAKNHGQFSSCVAKLTTGWMRSGLISGREKGMINRTAARAKLP